MENKIQTPFQQSAPNLVTLIYCCEVIALLFARINSEFSYLLKKNCVIVFAFLARYNEIVNFKKEEIDDEISDYILLKNRNY